jgi:hypothetical protein
MARNVVQFQKGLSEPEFYGRLPLPPIAFQQ